MIELSRRRRHPRPGASSTPRPGRSSPAACACRTRSPNLPGSTPTRWSSAPTGARLGDRFGYPRSAVSGGAAASSRTRRRCSRARSRTSAVRRSWTGTAVRAVRGPFIDFLRIRVLLRARLDPQKMPWPRNTDLAACWTAARSRAARSWSHRGREHVGSVVAYDLAAGDAELVMAAGRRSRSKPSASARAASWSSTSTTSPGRAARRAHEGGRWRPRRSRCRRTA